MPNNSTLPFQAVPGVGPLSTGDIYRRQHLNNRFGGNRMSGISVSVREPVVLLFHTEEPSQQFYEDGFDDDGVYWYSGEGTSGDMQWTNANRAIRDHMADGRDLLLFERVQRKDGLWRFAGPMRYLEHRIESRPDKQGDLREAIVFGLIEHLPIEADAPSMTTDVFDTGTADSIRQQIDDLTTGENLGPKERIQLVYYRSMLIVAYARKRADGTCEACSSPAPFATAVGDPFLEVHHLDRLADGGADRCDKVAAICPNCHRRIHYGADGADYNRRLAGRIATLEGVGDTN